MIIGGWSFSEAVFENPLTSRIGDRTLYVGGSGSGNTNYDGIGDKPYDIPEDASIDRYPLWEPYVTLEQPPLQITIKGGLGITATVRNLGNENATQVDWLWTLLGGYFVAPSLRYQSGTIPLLGPGQELVVVKTHALFGIGMTNVIVNVGKATAFRRGFLLGFFYVLFPESL